MSTITIRTIRCRGCNTIICKLAHRDADPLYLEHRCRCGTTTLIRRHIAERRHHERDAGTE